MRLLEVLRSVDLVLAEDTRRSRKLLAYFDIHVRLVCLERNREREMIPWVEQQLAGGRCLALLSDAGTPGLADPGGALLPALIQHGYPVSVIPGPSAITTSLLLSGLPMHTFLFHAFPPPKPGPRRRLYQSLAELQATLIFFESPYRLLATLGDLKEVLGDRPAAVCRELTKIHEEVLRGSLGELIATLAERKAPPRGEVTIVVGGRGTI